jgi:DNA repair and recombination protein RAD54B
MAKALEPGSALTVQGKEVEVESVMSKDDFQSGRAFLGTAGKPSMTELDDKMKMSVRFNAKPVKAEVEEEVDEVVEVPRPLVSTFKKPVMTKPLARTSTDSRPTSRQGDPPDKKPLAPAEPPLSQPTYNPTARFKNPVLDRSRLANIQPFDAEKPTPRHDPDAEGAVVMKRPATCPRGRQLVDVVLDPYLTGTLREHQVEGVKFMYECVTGMRDSGVGAILADEMGLGKTLQVIALLWTLLKQNPIHGAPPLIKKALIVCPVTLIKNWKKEFRKWLGLERIGVFTMEDKNSRITDFTKGKAYSVMIIGYEKLRSVQDDLRKYNNIDIVIADEGHRLKTAKNKSAEAIKSLSTDRRIILSGTPLQNDLSEFYTMVEFVNPGLLGKASTFKKQFETPIIKARQPDADIDEKEEGQARSEELQRLTSVFILRRTSEILSKYLPPKSEYIVFCDPTSTQARMYRDVLASPVFGAVLGSAESSLQLLMILKKVCNSPTLLKAKDVGDKEVTGTVGKMMADVKMEKHLTPASSGKFQTLDRLLHQIYSLGEKVVIVSHYTSTLDIIGRLVNALSYTSLRLDGTTPQSRRQDLVDKFNRTDHKVSFAFLLSAKSGGAGLNLIGASRLILYDTDWNPATDLQAMARIHRDGQKKHCHIYRLLTRGALDEKIYQRQLSKIGLADSIVDNKSSSGTFTKAELKKLFTLDETSDCQTHDLLGCACGGKGFMKPLPAQILPGTESPMAVTDDDEQLVDLAATTANTSDDDMDVDTSIKADSTPATTIKGEDSDDELPPVGMLIKASQIAAQERAIANGTAKYLKNDRFEHPRNRIKEGKKEGKMLALMQYEHIDGMLFRPMRSSTTIKDEDEEEDSKLGRAEEAEELSEADKEALVDDVALRKVLQDEDGHVRYVFARTTG